MVKLKQNIDYSVHPHVVIWHCRPVAKSPEQVIKMFPDNGSLPCLDPVVSHLNKAEWSLKNCLYSIDLRVVEFWQPLS